MQSSKHLAAPVPALAFALIALSTTAAWPPCQAQTPERIAGISATDLQGFADRLLGAIASRNIPAGNACVDWSAIVDTSLNGIGDGSRKAKDFSQGVKQGILASQNKERSLMGQIISNANAAENSYRLVRFREVDGKAHAVFRLIADGGLNYHEYQLEQRGGQVIATDIYIALTGENLSQTFRRAFLPMVQQMNKSWIGKLMSSDKALLENYQKVGQLNSLVAQGQGQAALDLYGQLPSELQSLKLLLAIRYQAASLVGDEELLEAIKAFEEAHPKDPALLLVSIDGFFLKGEYDKALESVDKLDEAVGGDVHLNQFRSDIEQLRGNDAAAVRYAKALVEGLPDEFDYRGTLIAALLQVENYAGVAQALTDVESDFDKQWNGISEKPIYADFVVSPEGKQWLRERGLLEEDPSPPVASTTEEPPRTTLTWIDKTGNFSVEATFVGVDKKAKTVELKKPNGETLTVPIKRLSPESVQQARELYKKQQTTKAGS